MAHLLLAGRVDVAEGRVAVERGHAQHAGLADVVELVGPGDVAQGGEGAEGQGQAGHGERVGVAGHACASLEVEKESATLGSAACSANEAISACICSDELRMNK
ncbi:hypothetical protein D3C72_1563060 [compost metagenome]